MEYFNAPNADKILMMEIRIFARIAHISIEVNVIIVNRTILAFFKRFAIVVDIY